MQMTRKEIMVRMDETAIGDGAAAEDRLLKAVEIQRELGVSRATAYRLMTDGTLPTYRFGGRNGRRPMVRVSLKELRAWLCSHRAGRQSAA
jgi:predicted DNA-binding transcriptional regulator AlpA